MIYWQPYTFYPEPSPDVDSYFYISFIAGFRVFKKTHCKTMETVYGFKADGLIWFGSEQQIRKFLTV